MAVDLAVNPVRAMRSRGLRTLLLLCWFVAASGSGRTQASPSLPSPGPPLEDAQRTMGLLRYHAAGWHLDPHKIGVLGFSAGGYLVAEISTR